MTCNNTPPLLEAYIDGELDAASDAVTISEIATHVANCPACLARVAATKQLSATLHRELPYHKAPDLLQARMRALVADASQRESAPASTKLRSSALKPGANRWQIFAIAASALFATVATHDIISSSARHSVSATVSDELVSAHIRSLMPNHLVDVPSSDRHTVKPWFEGKIEFAPPVFDFAADSFPLAGGRLDYTGGHKTAAIVFHHGQHAINLFVWPADSADTPVETSALNGYNIATWRRSHLRYSAVSTVNLGALTQFARLYVMRDSVTTATPVTK